MNELEKYNQDRVLIYTIPSVFHKRREMEAWSDGFEAGSIEGFNAAIALDLPVKFHIWTQKQEEPANAYLSGDDEWSVYLPNLDKKVVSTKELYEYWLNNVYKPE